MGYRSKYWGLSRTFFCDRCDREHPAPWGVWHSLCRVCFTIPFAEIDPSTIEMKYWAPRPFCSICQRGLLDLNNRDEHHPDTPHWVCSACVHPDHSHHWSRLQDEPESLDHCQACGAMRMKTADGYRRCAVGTSSFVSGLIRCPRPLHEARSLHSKAEREFFEACFTCSHEFSVIGHARSGDPEEELRSWRSNEVGWRLFPDWEMARPGGRSYHYEWCSKCGQLDIVPSKHVR